MGHEETCVDTIFREVLGESGKKIFEMLGKIEERLEKLEKNVGKNERKVVKRSETKKENN